MFRSIYWLAALCLCSSLSWADSSPTAPTAERSCSGVTNEVTKGRELNRELNAYAGQTVPDELQQRVMKHLTLVAKLKAECESTREQSAAAKK
jgi:hypothetical protein